MTAGTRITLAGSAVLIAMVGLFATRPVLLDRAEYALVDWRFQQRGAREPVGRVGVVAIDARSIDALGRWPWSRSVVAELIERLTEADVSAIGLDFVFSEAETPRDIEAVRVARRALVETGTGSREDIAVLDRVLAEVDTDERLADAIHRSRRCVLGYFFRTGRGEENDLAGLPSTLRTLRRSKFSVAKAPLDSRAPILTCTGVEANIPILQESARRAGFFSAQKDLDGALRRAPLVARCGGEFYMALAIGVLEIVSGKRAILLGNAEALDEIRVGDSVFSTDEGGKIQIDYRGPVGTFPYFSAVDVIDGSVGREALEGMAVLVGPTEVGLRDFHTTPFGSSMPGVEIHANILDSLLSGSVPHRNDELLYTEIGIVIVLGLLPILVVPRMRGTLGGALFTALLVAGFVAGSLYVFIEHDIAVNMAYPLATLSFVYLTLEITRSMTVEAGSRRIRRMFATYVPPEVVDELTQNQESFKLGGERRDISILFSDVRDFTSLSERLGAENVTLLMNTYLTAMTRIVFDSRGTLDKYIGDAIVAFWGAPLPLDDHPLRACESALFMQDEIARLRREQPDLPGVDSLRVGIGIHAAEVVVGNLGSELRFDYTITGDGVNLCSRLEGLTKVYGVAVLASHDLVARLPTGFLTRELDVIRVKGKKEAVRIFEVLGRRDAEADESTAFDAYASGFAAYREGRWDDAERALRECHAMLSDKASLTLLERIDGFRRESPRDWEGIWSFATK